MTSRLGLGEVGGLIAMALLAAVLHPPAAAAAEPTAAEEQAFRAAVARVADAVVRIEPVVTADAAGGTAEAAAGSGPSTGLVIDPAGWVLTTAFTVPRDVTDVVVVRPDGGRQAARAVGRDLPRGLVLLQTDPLPTTPLEIAPRDGLAPGQWAIAVGRGWTAAAPSVAVGVLSAVNRAWGRAVQTDASVSPVNYGGPLLDIRGRVIGLLAPLPADTAGMKLGTELYDAGIGFAVPLEDVQRLRPRLEAGETLAGGILGLSYLADDLINGEPVIASCRPGSPAARAGLRPGDRIVAIDGQRVERIADARQRIAPRHAGDAVRIEIERGARTKQRLTLEATLVAALPPWRQAMLGIIAGPAAEGEAGVPVEWVLPDGPAARAGLAAGDVIVDVSTAAEAEATTTAEEPAIRTVADLAGRLAGLEPGEPATVGVRRAGQRTELRVETAPLDPQVPGDLPPLTIAAGIEAAARLVRLAAADVAEPALALVPPGDSQAPLGVLVYCGLPHGRVTDAEATIWQEAAARHDVAVILIGSADPQRWTKDDVPQVARALAALHGRRPIDPRRVAVAGTAAGGAFAWLVAERLPGTIRGVAVQEAALPRRAEVPAAEPGRGLWVLFGDAEGDVGQRIAADRLQLERAGHAVGRLPQTARDAVSVDELCRWVRVLGML